MELYDYSATDATGAKIPLANFKGKVLMIVNTATGCGFTPHYEALEQMYRKYQAQGFEIIDIPCNQFGGQAQERMMRFTSFVLCTTKPLLHK